MRTNLKTVVQYKRRDKHEGKFNVKQELIIQIQRKLRTKVLVCQQRKMLLSIFCNFQIWPAPVTHSINKE